MPKFFVVYTKSLKKGRVTVKGFDEYSEMVEFAENKKAERLKVLVADFSYVDLKAERHYDLKDYGVFSRIKNSFFYFGFCIFELAVIVFLVFKCGFN